ncbi:MAG: hypothetical protein WCP29_11350 [Acidobacteriota bacterium]
MAHPLAHNVVRFNPRYELDGCDPGGYAGIAWAIGGKHDRGWGPKRPTAGTVRYLSLASTSRTFDVHAFIRRVETVTGRTIPGQPEERRRDGRR